MATQVNGTTYATTPGELLRQQAKNSLLRQAKAIEKALANCGMPDADRARYQANADGLRAAAKKITVTTKGAK